MGHYDSLKDWRKENGIGVAQSYAGSCEGDATADAIREYMEKNRTAVVSPATEITDETAEVEVAEIDGEDLTQ